MEKDSESAKQKFLISTLSNTTVLNSIFVPIFAVIGINIYGYLKNGSLDVELFISLSISLFIIIFTIISIVFLSSKFSSQIVSDNLRKEIDEILGEYKKETDKARSVKDLVDKQIFLPNIKNNDEVIHKFEMNAKPESILRVFSPNLSNDIQHEDNVDIIYIVKENIKKNVFYEFYIPDVGSVKSGSNMKSFCNVHREAIISKKMKIYLVDEYLFNQMSCRHAMSIELKDAELNEGPLLLLEMPIKVIRKSKPIDVWMRADAEFTQEWHRRFFEKIEQDDNRILFEI